MVCIDDLFKDNGSNPSPSEQTTVRKLEPISSSLLEIKTKAYNNKALILIGQMKNPEAFQMLVLSLQCTPGKHPLYCIINLCPFIWAPLNKGTPEQRY